MAGQQPRACVRCAEPRCLRLERARADAVGIGFAKRAGHQCADVQPFYCGLNKPGFWDLLNKASECYPTTASFVICDSLGGMSVITGGSADWWQKQKPLPLKVGAWYWLRLDILHVLPSDARCGVAHYWQDVGSRYNMVLVQLQQSTIWMCERDAPASGRLS